MSNYARGPFEVRYGKWGAYLWSACGDEDMTLQRVADTLNGQRDELTRLRELSAALREVLPLLGLIQGHVSAAIGQMGDKHGKLNQIGILVDKCIAALHPDAKGGE